MVFSSVIFLGIFLPVVLILYFVIKNRTWRNAVLLVASIIFYAWGEPKWIFLLLLLSFVDYLIARKMEKLDTGIKKKVFLVIAVVLNLSTLFVVKYLDFVITTINSAVNTNIPLTNIAMPIGISFFTFQALTYVIDVYRKDAKAQKSYWDLLLYISMFPQLIAGPIVRYSDIDSQIKNRKETMQGFINGMFRFSIGLAKKVVFANYAGNIATSLLVDNFDGISTKALWVGIIMFTLQLYFDFSGYSDMAIGLGKVFGFDYKENFNYPYMANSISDFWRRWHISLGSFFRDYVYIPLGGNRKHWVLNILVVWFLTGLWHGASWNYVLWGLFFAIMLIIEKLLKKKGLDTAKVPVAGNILILFIIVYSMTIFYFEDIGQLITATKIMFGFGNVVNITIAERTIICQYFWIIPLMILACTPLVSMLGRKIFKENTVVGNITRSIAFCVLLVLCFMLILNQTYNPFLYFRF
ncbi:MAG: MBOAT family O-acyltransferase [Butyrivibrio sp.]